ncbi:potassium channel family protein [Bogoriella caseilytica]|uniref:Voltage-gated potassium channel n=1 Tax=Bogoriella caseilytica TaxID=56055 RepID=A0A3N2BCV7_9MICO|nr:potassium channel family protein [Bogoriella caseilytica]ROR73079.1 voltage-gated potassium channel [Bogoriella caseilytica]
MTERTQREERRQRWERRAEWPLVASALLFLVAYALPISWPEAPSWVPVLCGITLTAVWIVFGLDYVARLVLSFDRRSFIRENLLDLATLVLPLLRPLRLLRLVTLLSVLNRTGSGRLRGQVVTYMAGGAILLVVSGGLALTDAERGQPGSTIDSVGDGLWWAVVTVTTVGYGDTYPVTTVGRIIAVGLMIGGIAVLGLVTATLASWLVERVTESNDAERAASRSQVAELGAELRELRALVERGAPCDHGEEPPAAPSPPAR